jgi:hypothetical protein
LVALNQALEISAPVVDDDQLVMTINGKILATFDLAERDDVREWILSRKESLQKKQASERDDVREWILSRKERKESRKESLQKQAAQAEKNQQHEKNPFTGEVVAPKVRRAWRTGFLWQEVLEGYRLVVITPNAPTHFEAQLVEDEGLAGLEAVDGDYYATDGDEGVG